MVERWRWSIAANAPCRQPAVVLQRDDDVAVFDHVVVGENLAYGRVDDHARGARMVPRSIAGSGDRAEAGWSPSATPRRPIC
jgi:hypothetical protein